MARRVIAGSAAIGAALALAFYGGTIVGNVDKSAERSADARKTSENSDDPVVRYLSSFHSSGDTFTVRAKRLSYFTRTDQDSLVPIETDDGLYYEVGDGEYSHEVAFNGGNAALVVMDPWEDSGSDFLNQYYRPVHQDGILPLVEKFVELGVPVFVFTNAPNAAAYGVEVFDELEAMGERGDLTILRHADYDDDAFAELLRSHGIRTLIYAGFASNKCVIGRRVGIIPMLNQGLRAYFVPGASAAVERPDTWASGEAHREATLLIKQYGSGVLELEELLALTRPDRSD